MIYLIRHGLDDERYIGGYSDVSLIDEGISQVMRARDYIVKEQLPITKIYSSDIKRARETASIINDSLKKEVIYLSTLREQDKGLLTGLEKNKAYSLYPEYKDLEDINKRYPEGESLRDLYNRVLKELRNFDDDNVLLVTHRGVINMIYYILTGTKLDMDKEKFGVIHGSIHELDLEKLKIRKIF